MARPGLHDGGVVARVVNQLRLHDLGLHLHIWSCDSDVCKVRGNAKEGALHLIACLGRHEKGLHVFRLGKLGVARQLDGAQVTHVRCGVECHINALLLPMRARSGIGLPPSTKAWRTRRSQSSRFWND